MNSSGTEIETKFYVLDLKKIELRLQSLEARLVQPRQFEQNLRFDFPDGLLGKSYRVLRLRQNEKVVLTYKGPGTKPVDGIRTREEWEVTISDFAVMQKILESLGYVIQFTYEKIRSTYALEEELVMLDEMPFGSFVEIEASSQIRLLALADRLLLKRETAIPDSYQVLFQTVKTAHNLTFRDLTFKNFFDIEVSPLSLSATFADEED